tara:strand:+ start:2682 stop:3116 length:435 start_codon:yes stop_codon:yes gene_type:complete
MKFLISHRGNIAGPNLERENDPDYILEAINAGYDVEIDVWYVDNNFFLGHDEPQHLIDESFLKNKNLWCHAKNVDALNEMLRCDIHCFWHEKDTVTLTSKGYIWAYPGMQPIKNSIAVMPELNDDDISECTGICSDRIEAWGRR